MRGGEGDCVEVRDDVPGAVPVRDSKNPAGPVLMIAGPAWRAFVGSLGRADRPLSRW
ncbi:DUF397 domain-containing protein [Streptomyces sp. NPDC013953]|uniref:DUF397 domain-containing protein n=1 Tax=Streptomyces sp. NPDC013953 TaxID=3364868 RepID=UPI0036F6F053